MTHSANHALVFGASGLIGWSVVDQLLSGYPKKDSFTRVTAITNRPMNPSETRWPEPEPERPELQIVSGIDLRLHTQKSLLQALKDSVQEIENVTHVFYFVFASVDEYTEEVAVNRKMMEVAIDALNVLSPNLQFVVFPGGTRGYGIYIPGGTFQPPLSEDMVDNLPEDYAQTCVYPVFRQILAKTSSGKKWTWCEVCPDAIIGFTPNGSQFSLALHWAQYLSLYAYNHGIGPHTIGLEELRQSDRTITIQIPFPGIEAAWTAKNTPVAAKTIACFSIYASLHPEECGGGQLFNIADRERPSTCEELWPRLAAWFGLVGVGPTKPVDHEPDLTPGEYIERYQDVFKQHSLDKAATSGVSAGRKQLDSVGTWLTFDRHLSLNKLRESGFAEEFDPTDAWIEAFYKFREAELIL